MSDTTTSTYSYSVTDIEIVMRRFAADIVMIASSSGAFTEDKARAYAHDAEVLAKAGHLTKIDLTLFSGAAEVKAVTYEVRTSSGELTTSRPGGVMWPRVPNPNFRIVLSYSDTYTASVHEQLKGRLKIAWAWTDADTTHSSLALSGGRDYASNGFGIQRKDYSS